eukprot:CAMPEP_0195296842 /NCGR_PEP_ID=MMETSP0707-20130614/20280_1 /TAXON_ID=33640 /ORGANISM="Asterionellopsis glacialis, Strain CCMP134" /LENGTH=574 /DNA_ID=CAMNT_0040358463 /DNA_START=233 /DNA_END=1954 /DNA_ORIENTATION=-
MSRSRANTAPTIVGSYPRSLETEFSYPHNSQLNHPHYHHPYSADTSNIDVTSVQQQQQALRLQGNTEHTSTTRYDHSHTQPPPPNTNMNDEYTATTTTCNHQHRHPKQQHLADDGDGITRIVSIDSHDSDFSSCNSSDDTSTASFEDKDGSRTLSDSWRDHHRPPPQSLMPSTDARQKYHQYPQQQNNNNAGIMNGEGSAASLPSPPPIHPKKTTSDPKKKKRNCKRILFRMLISTTMVGSVGFVAVDFFTNQYLKAALGDFLDWMAHHSAAGTFAFIGLFIIASLVFFPPSLLQLGIGWVYTETYGVTKGIFLGTLVSYVGCSLGASIAFCRSRYMMRGLVKRFAKRYSIIRAVDTAIKTEGFRIYILLRLSPVVPFNALNYIGGITGITFRTYFESMIGILPKTIMTVFIGATAGSAGDRGLNGEEDRNVALISTIIGSAMGFLVVVYTSIYARKELNKIILKQQVEGALEEAEDDGVDHSVEVILQTGSSHDIEEEKTEEMSYSQDSSIELGGMPLNTRTRYEVNSNNSQLHQQLTRYDVPYDSNLNNPELRYPDSDDDSDEEDTEWFWMW